MEKYDYKRTTIDNIKDWIVNDSDILEEEIEEEREDDLYNWIYDEIFDEDSVTGNGAYYYDTEEKCSEYLAGNFDILYEAVREFAVDDEANVIIKHYENKDLARYFDCTIRCYILMDCIYTAVDELIKDGRLRYLTNK